MRRFTGLAAVLGTAAVAVALFATPAAAQQTICSGVGFATTTGTNACNTTANNVTATASVRNSAKLTLEQVFGSPAGGLTAAFGNIDAFCLTTPGAGILCSAGASSATWYGNLQFGVKLSGLGVTTAKLTGVRPTAGSIPAGQLLDSAAGVPATAYPVSPSAAIDLKTAMGNGNTTVTRVFGVQVQTSDAAASWSSDVQYSVVIE
jgi:hypothetical protein